MLQGDVNVPCTGTGFSPKQACKLQQQRPDKLKLLTVVALHHIICKLERITIMKRNTAAPPRDKQATLFRDPRVMLLTTAQFQNHSGTWET